MLQSSGTITLSQIRSELGLGSGTSPFLLGAAIAGEYVSLSCSDPRPDLINPAKLSEWYLYDHSAICGGSCVTATGAFASMQPCAGGTIDDYMGASVSLDGNVDVNTLFDVNVTYTSYGASCSSTTSTITIQVIVLAGTDYGITDACSSGGQYFPSGANICSVCISNCENPNVSIGAVAGCEGEILCSPPTPSPAPSPTPSPAPSPTPSPAPSPTPTPAPSPPIEPNREYTATDCGTGNPRTLIIDGNPLFLGSVYRITSSGTSQCFTVDSEQPTADPPTYIESNTEVVGLIAFQLEPGGCASTNCSQV